MHCDYRLFVGGDFRATRVDARLEPIPLGVLGRACLRWSTGLSNSPWGGMDGLCNHLAQLIHWALCAFYLANCDCYEKETSSPERAF